MSEPTVLLALLLAVTDPAAVAVPDPTQPPAQVAPAQAGTGGVPRLQSTLIGAGRRAAVIDGRLLREGERLGEAVLEHVEPGRVVLRGPQGELELTLSFTSPDSGASR